jgi:hypothetical protein
MGAIFVAVGLVGFWSGFVSAPLLGTRSCRQSIELGTLPPPHWAGQDADHGEAANT